MTKNSFRFQAPRFKFRVVVTAVELKQLEQAVPDFYAGSCLTRRTADSSSRNAVSFSSASQGSANYRRDARQQRRLFERQNPQLRRSPKSNRLCSDCPTNFFARMRGNTGKSAHVRPRIMAVKTPRVRCNGNTGKLLVSTAVQLPHCNGDSTLIDKEERC